MSKETSTTGGISFLGLLTIAFIVLKLCKVIAWSWWWVLSPFTIPIALILLILIGMLLFNIMQAVAPPEPPHGDISDKVNKKSKWQQRLEEMEKEKL